MDQHKEKEGDNSEESTDQRKEEEEDSEESMDQRKGDEEENNSEEPTDQREEESSEEAMAASSLFAHPCSLLQYIARVCACCLGFRASFSDPKPSAASDAPAPGNPSQEREDKKPSYFYMQEVITRVWAARRRPRPTPPGNPIEGSGGNGGQHN